MRSRMALAVVVLGLVLVIGSTTAQAGTGSITLKFHLPFSGAVNTPKTGFKITNAGSGNGLEGDATGSGNGVYGSSTSGNAGVWGTNSGSGFGIFGHADAGGIAGVYATASGSVTGVWGNSGSGDGVHGSTGGSGNGVEGTSPDGNGVYGTSTNGYGASAWTTNGFAGIGGFTSGANNGVYGDANNSTASGVYGHNEGTGNGVAGISDNGAGGFFQGKTAGAYFSASGGGSNPAIKVGSGGVEVFGAGTDTSTPVFRHIVTGSNTCGVGMILNNPYLNGNPNAFLFLQDTYADETLIPEYNWGGCPSGRWVVLAEYNNQILNPVPGQSFNVLVVDP